MIELCCKNTHNQAQEYLNRSSWELASAITDFYNPDESVGSPNTSPPSSNSAAKMASSQSSATQKKKKFATLGDLNGSASRPSRSGSDEDEESDDLAEDPNLYAGGEKSGLAIENPDDLKRKIIERAKRLVQFINTQA